MRKDDISHLVTESQYSEITATKQHIDDNQSHEAESHSEISTQQSVDGVYKMSIDDSGKLLDMMKEGKRISNGTILNFIKVTFPEIWNNRKDNKRGNLIDDVIEALKKKGASQLYSVSDEFITVFVERLIGSREDLIKALEAVNLVEQKQVEMEYSESNDEDNEDSTSETEDLEDQQEQNESE